MSIAGIKIDRLHSSSLDSRYSSIGHVMQALTYRASLFQPLRQPRFRRLWLANLVSNVGSWGQAFAAVWHVSTLSESALMPSLVQTATWAPMLLFALPAGLLADAMHKPRLLFHSNALMGLTAGAMALLTIAGTPSALLVLLMTFVMGAGAAFTLPAWQASMPELVAKEDIAAVASLNNISYNVAALAGPCMGGLLVQQYGPAPLYVFNSLSVCGLLWFYKQWHPQEKADAPIQRSTRDALLAGVAASWQAVRYRKLLLHSLPIFCASIAFPALLPSLVRGAHADAGNFGVLMGALGAGAVIASAILPRLRQHLRPHRLLAGALAIYSAMLGLVGLGLSLGIRVLLIVCGGMAWSAIVTTLNRAALVAFPATLRARTLSIYIFMVAAGQAIGGALWGQLAIRFGIIPMLVCAAAAMLMCAASIFCSTDFLEDE
jgi:predicted MFS family arabinose efflux permease